MRPPPPICARRGLMRTAVISIRIRIRCGFIVCGPLVADDDPRKMKGSFFLVDGRNVAQPSSKRGKPKTLCKPQAFGKPESSKRFKSASITSRPPRPEMGAVSGSDCLPARFLTAIAINALPKNHVSDSANRSLNPNANQRSRIFAVLCRGRCRNKHRTFALRPADEIRSILAESRSALPMRLSEAHCRQRRNPARCARANPPTRPCFRRLGQEIRRIDFVSSVLFLARSLTQESKRSRVLSGYGC